MIKIQSFIFLLVLLAFSIDSFPLGMDRNCPRVLPLKGFDFNRYSGQWYEILSNQGFLIYNSRCNRVNFALTRNGTSYANFTGLAASNKPYTFTSRLFTINPSIPNIFIYNYNDNPYVVQNTLYGILDTDYVRYSINVQCGEFGDKSVFIYSRNPFFDLYNDNLLVERIVTVLRSFYGSTQTNLSRTDQVNCGYIQQKLSSVFINQNQPVSNGPPFPNIQLLPGNPAEGE